VILCDIVRDSSMVYPIVNDILCSEQVMWLNKRSRDRNESDSVCR